MAAFFDFTGVAVPFGQRLHSQENPVWITGRAGARFWGEGGGSCDYSCKKTFLMGGKKKHILTWISCSLPAHRWTLSVWIQPGLCWCPAAKTGPPPFGTPAATQRCSKSTVTMGPFTTWPSVPVCLFQSRCNFSLLQNYFLCFKFQHWILIECQSNMFGYKLPA